MKVNINRQLAGLEDIVFGTGTVMQERQGELVEITKVNLGNLPFSETLSAAEVLTPIYEQVVPHMDEILLANDNATIASTKAVEAAASAAAALLSEQAAAASEVLIASHLIAEDNPHSVTKTQVGLSNVDNTSDIDKPVSTAQQAALDSITKAQVGLSNVDNTSDADKPVSTAQQAALDDKSDDNTVMHLTGDEAISGSKDFTGTLQVNGSNVTAYGKNYIINGGFDYWNYATSQTTNGYGSDDRWNNGSAGSTKVHSMVNATDTERALFNSSKFSRTAVTSVAGVNNHVSKDQAIENVTKLAGKTITISFWAKADSSKNISVDVYQTFGTGGSPSAGTSGTGVLVALTTTWQKKTITWNVPSIVGKTLGTDGVHTTATRLRFFFDAGATFSTISGSLGQQSGTFDIAEVKLEEGSVATPWTPYEGEFGGEIQACQRYYEKWANTGTLIGVNYNTTAGVCAPVKFNSTKRIIPTCTFTSNPTYGTNTGTISSIAVSGANIYEMTFSYSGSSLASWGTSTTNGGVVTISAEL